MELAFTDEELRSMEKSAFYYARLLLKEVKRLKGRAAGYDGLRTFYFERVMWHRKHAKDIRRLRMSLCPTI